MVEVEGLAVVAVLVEGVGVAAVGVLVVVVAGVALGFVVAEGALFLPALATGRSSETPSTSGSASRASRLARSTVTASMSRAG